MQALKPYLDRHRSLLRKAARRTALEQVVEGVEVVAEPRGRPVVAAAVEPWVHPAAVEAAVEPWVPPAAVEAAVEPWVPPAAVEVAAELWVPPAAVAMACVDVAAVALTVSAAMAEAHAV